MYPISTIQNSLGLFILTSLLLGFLNPESLQAQTPANAPVSDVQRGIQPVPAIPTPEKLPSVEELLQSGGGNQSPNQDPNLNKIPGKIIVEKFEVEGSTVFSADKLAEVTQDFTNKPISFAELLKAADVVTKLYLDEGYITSGAFIPGNQSFQVEGGVVKIQVVEGTLESIEVSGTKRLNSNYVRSRLAIATGKPLNQNKLLQALRLLQLDPLIKNIKADLAAGIRPGTNILNIEVKPAKTRTAKIKLDNNRAPSIGSFQRQVQLNEANLLGLGDSLNVAYSNTDGSDSVNVNYKLPVNPRNGTLAFNYSNSSTKVIEEPFDFLDIKGDSQEYGITFRQPVIQTPTKELGLGISAAHRTSDIGFLEAVTGERLPYPSPGVDSDGKSKVSVVRLFQDWTQRNNKEVFAARSQFSVGINALDATVNENAPDSEFLSWRGQAQWVRLLAPETLIFLRTDAQIANGGLLASEQIGAGGQATVRGYRQDQILSDNAVLASAELRYPILRVPKIKGVLQVTPFLDFGTGWNSSDIGRTPLTNKTLLSTGLGLLWQQNNRLTARLDWGIPIISVESEKNSWQENGLHFSVVYTQPF